MKVWPKGKPGEPGEALVFDGSATTATAIVAWCGPEHALFDAAIGSLSVLGEPVPPGSSVVNPYRGGFEVVDAAGFTATWERG